jgi:hypothetical protein
MTTDTDAYHPNIELIRNAIERNRRFWPEFAVRDIETLLGIVDAYRAAVSELREADAAYWETHAADELGAFEQAEIARDAAVAKVLEAMGE